MALFDAHETGFEMRTLQYVLAKKKDNSTPSSTLNLIGVMEVLFVACHEQGNHAQGRPAQPSLDVVTNILPFFANIGRHQNVLNAELAAQPRLVASS